MNALLIVLLFPGPVAPQDYSPLFSRFFVDILNGT